MPSKLVIPERGVVIAERLHRASSFVGRMRGLLGRRQLVQGEALLLSPCRQVHTFGMRYPIDVVFCDRNWHVTHVVRSMAPRRISRIDWSARHTIELRAGAAASVAVGDRLLVEELRL